MRAAVIPRHGPAEVLRVDDVPLPRPRHHEVLIRVRAAALNPKDLMVRKGNFAPLSGIPPLRVGQDLAGEVAEGSGDLKAGAEVWGMLNLFRFGSCAQYVCAKRSEIGLKPPGLTMAQAASLPLVAQTSLQAFRDLARLQPGQHVIINGASGGVGTIAIQLAKAMGAMVTALCSTKNHELVRDLGADAAIDYRDLQMDALPAAHVFYDVFGNRSAREVRRALGREGIYISTIPSAKTALALAIGGLTRPRSALVLVKSRRRDLDVLAQYVRQGTLRAVVDKEMPLNEIRQAQGYLETKRARGKVVIAVP